MELKKAEDLKNQEFKKIDEEERLRREKEL